MIDSGNTAWVLTTCALVLFMTMPGLVLYYAGMVRAQHVLATVMQTFSITCLISFLWLCFGYSLCFAPVNSNTGNPIIGDSSRMWLRGLTVILCLVPHYSLIISSIQEDTVHNLAPTIPETVFCIRQLTFAIVTPALISGSFAHRMKFRSMLIFVALWHIFVYCPIAHANWHHNGFLNKLGSLDFAGGNVVHVAAGTASLVASIVVGNKGFSIDRFEPHNILLTVMGSCFLWIGWLGFNAGSFGEASGRAGFALLATQISSSCGALTWMLTEWYFKESPTILGMLSGAIAGLLAVTPAAGFIDQTGAFFIGTIAGPVCYFGVQLKHAVGVEDSMDAFGLHAIGGSLGGIMVGFFAKAELSGINGIIYGGDVLLGYQVVGVLVSIGWSGCMTYLLLHAIDKSIGLRLGPDNDDSSVDASIHGSNIRSSILGSTRDLREPLEVEFGGVSTHHGSRRIRSRRNIIADSNLSDRGSVGYPNPSLPTPASSSLWPRTIQNTNETNRNAHSARSITTTDDDVTI